MRHFWRVVPHMHIPWHPGAYTLWYCWRCRLALNTAGPWLLSASVPYPEKLKYSRRDTR